MNLSPATAPKSTGRRGRATRITLTTLLAGGLVLAAPLAASAHIGITPAPDATAGGSGVLTFSFNHGCDDSPTTSLDIEIPDGIASVYPTITPGWTIDVTRDAADGLVSRVVYSAEEPVESGFRNALELGVGYSDDTAGETLVFPVIQTCVDGKIDWIEVVPEGADHDSVESPAPTVIVGEASAEGDHHGGATDDGAADESESDDHADASAEAGESVLPVVLGGAGLALGAAALVVAVLAFRRSRA